MTTQEIRENFIAYFRSKKHKLLNPSKVFIDESREKSQYDLYFVNAGMNQLTNVFLDKQHFDDKYSMLTNCQTCIRAGGKHNDLDDVGKDSYHLTSFGMLGNWSLNKYWKEESIKMAFEYLTQECKLDSNRMYATYFQGTDEISMDVESKTIWEKYLPSDHIIQGSFKDNFWMMGDTGPCGACTEIHYDIIGNRLASNLVNKDDPNVIEIWNIVFMEYNKTNTYEKLQKKYVDTGMGLERLSMVLQNKTSVFQTDVFTKLFLYAQILGSTQKYTDTYDVINKNYMTDKAYRIFADHMRTIVIALYDGVVFDSFGRGAILRKIFRRLLMNFYIYLNNCQVYPVMTHHIIPAVITEILNFHLLKKHSSLNIRKILVEEENVTIGKINKFKNKYNSILARKKNTEEVMKYLLDKKDLLKEQDGVDSEVIENIDKININMVGLYDTYAL